MQWDGSKWITAPGTPDTANATASAPVSAGTEPVTQSSEASDLVINPDPSINVPVTDPDPLPTTVPSDIPATADIPPVPVTATPPTEEDTIVPSPTILASDKAAAIPPTLPLKNSIITPVTAVSNTAKSKSASSKNKTSRKSSVTATGDGKDTTANDTATDQLQASVAAPKENNHIKIIILAAVAFIGMALFLLLERFKASKE